MSQHKILLIVEEYSLSNLLKHYLSAYASMVDTVSEKSQALKYIAYYKYDTVILDLLRSNASGLSILKKIQDITITRVLTLCSFHRNDIAFKSLEIGAYDYLTKPYEDLVIYPT